MSDAIVAAAYPTEWAQAKSKQRTKLRKRYREDVAMGALRASGARCLTCEHYRTPYFGEGIQAQTSMICGLHSDFHGSLVKQPDSLCLDWRGCAK